MPEPAGHERQHRERLPVDPLRVVDGDQHRLPFGRGGQQRQRAGRDEEPVALAAGPGPAQGGGQRVPLRAGDRVQPVPQRQQQRQQGAVPQGQLGGYAGGAQHLESGRRPGSDVEQGRLADARLAHQAQARARPLPRGLEHRGDLGQLGRAPDDHRPDATGIGGSTDANGGSGRRIVPA